MTRCTDRRRPWPAAAARLLCLVIAGCGGDTGRVSSGGPAGRPWFADITSGSGVGFSHVRSFEQRFWFPEITGSGLALLDYDSDGDLDLYFVQSGDLDPQGAALPGNRLYANQGQGRFTDVTDSAGVGDTGYGMGCATGDYDGDGDVDLYVTNYGPNVLYRNEGDGTFRDVTDAAGAGDPGWGLSAAFVDIDADGDLDLYVCNYVNWSKEHEIACKSKYGDRDYCSPKNYKAPARDTLYENQNGVFRDISSRAGLDGAFGNGMGVVCADFDLDGDVDIFVANDGVPNQLWVNQGDARFEDEGLFSGCAVNMHGAAEASMGVAAADVDCDGDLDLLMTHLRAESNTFYLNAGGMFTDRTPQTGIAQASLQYTGFGMGFADFDCDGVLDLYLVNGRVGQWKPAPSRKDIYAEPDQLFRGLGGVRFQEIPKGGTDEDFLATGRGAAFGDLDNDGDLDVVVSNSQARPRILENICSPRGHWVLLRVQEGRRDAIGAAVRLTAGGRVQWRRVDTAYSYCSANDPRVHFGLGPAATIDEVLVIWPGGERERFGPLPADRMHEIVRGRGEHVAKSE